jgi:hypothetical protein
MVPTAPGDPVRRGLASAPASFPAPPPSERTVVPRRRTVCLLGVLVVLLAGCRLGVDAEVTLERDGSGTAALVLRLDEGLLGELDALGVDPTAELSAAAAAAPAWELERTAPEDGGLVLALRRDAATPEELTDALRELTAGLDDADPALVTDLDLRLEGDGAAALDGSLVLRPPIGPGVVADEETARELADLVATSVDATLTVTLPGEVDRADADRVDGRSATWQVRPDEPRTVMARSAAPTGWERDAVVLVVGVALLLVSGAVLLVVARRRRADQQRT